MSQFLLFPVFFPFLAGPFAYWIGCWYEKARNTFVMSAAALELFLVLTLWTKPELAQATAAVEGFCGLGIQLRAGGFHTLMALLTATGWMAATVFCREYMAHVHKQNRFYLFWLMTLGATMGVFLSVDLFTAFLFFEIMSFTSFVLVVQTEEYPALKAGETYLAVAVIGGLAALTGLFLLYHQLGTLSLDAMAAAAAGAEDRGLLWVGGLLVLVGFGAKAGAFPLHIWLPTAHPAAPAPASAVLSGVITKTGIYGVLVLSTTVFLHDVQWGLLLAVLGAVTMVLGAVLAVLSVDLKRTLACSSISQIGFILVGTAMLCLLGDHNALAVDGTILHILNHSLIKMVLFPAAGIIHLTTHSFDLNDIRGFGRGKPLLALVMGLPMLSLAGVPGLNGYVSKTLLHESIVEYIHLTGEGAALFQVLEALFLFSGGLTLAYMLKLFVCLFLERNALPEEVLARKWRQEGEHYIAPASVGGLLSYLLVMLRLGTDPGAAMDPIAAFARDFLGGTAPAHAVDYFAAVNLEGAAVSAAIGAGVYLLVVRTLLIRRGRYVDPIPPWLDLERGLYRPALRFLAQTAIVLATLVDRLGPRLLFHGIPCLFQRLRLWWTGTRDQLLLLLTGEVYSPRPTVEQAADDFHFARYEDEPRRLVGFTHSLAFGLLLTGLGLVFGLLFILLH